MELQFYPPGEAPFVDGISCDNAHWCAALTSDSLEAHTELRELQSQLHRTGQLRVYPGQRRASLGRVVPRGWLLLSSAAASVLLVVYGGLNVLLGALVLSGVIHPAGSVDRAALRWHVGVWDLWFLVWGILLALATVGYWRRTVRSSGA
jgi:hypothetical protein